MRRAWKQSVGQGHPQLQWAKVWLQPMASAAQATTLGAALDSMRRRLVNVASDEDPEEDPELEGEDEAGVEDGDEIDDEEEEDDDDDDEEENSDNEFHDEEEEDDDEEEDGDGDGVEGHVE